MRIREGYRKGTEKAQETSHEPFGTFFFDSPLYILLTKTYGTSFHLPAAAAGAPPLSAAAVTIIASNNDRGSRRVASQAPGKSFFLLFILLN